MAFDTGPGNVMMDHVMRARQNKSYDRNGDVARGGTVDGAMLDELKGHDYFKRPIPRSAWRLDFGSSYADKMMAKYRHLSDADMMATVTEFSAYAITQSIIDNVKILSEISVIMASGGGTRNAF